VSAAAAPTFWRCFPWDSAAPPGAPFSPFHVPSGQSSGRFDLGDAPPVLYASDTPTHAIAEALQGFRNRAFKPAMLRRLRRPLALVGFRLADAGAPFADLCDPDILQRDGIRPDRTAHHDRKISQRIARTLYESGAGVAGLQWWSTFTGAWHTRVWFLDRVAPSAAEIVVPPRELTATDPDVRDARTFLNIPDAEVDVA
jgi:hypothetical protein